jgi:hypothetical protein
MTGNKLQRQRNVEDRVDVHEKWRKNRAERKFEE